MKILKSQLYCHFISNLCKELTFEDFSQSASWNSQVQNILSFHIVTYAKS